MNAICAKCRGKCCQCVTIAFKTPDASTIAWMQMRGKVRIDGGKVEWTMPVRCEHLHYLGQTCTIYEDRPDACRAMDVDGVECRKVRGLE